MPSFLIRVDDDARFDIFAHQQYQPSGAGSQELTDNMAKNSPAFLLSKINHLGDAIAFLPTVFALRKLFPAAKIDVVCTPLSRIIFERSVPGIRTVCIDYESARGAKALIQVPGIMGRLAIGQYDFALLSHDEPKFAFALSVAVLARHRVGFSLVNRHWGRLLTTVLPFHTGRNIVDLNFDLVRLAAGSSDMMPSRVPIGYDQAEMDTIQQKLASVGIAPGAKFVAIQPKASLTYRQWGLPNYLAVAEGLHTRHGITAVIITEKDEPGLPYPHKISNLTLPQLAAFLDEAHVFLGNNSGPMHLAAAMGTSTLVISGPSADEWTIPWTDVPHDRISATHLGCVPCERVGSIPGRCTNTAYPSGCMLEISPDAVLNRLGRML